MSMDETESIVEERFPVGDSPELSLGTVSGRVSVEPSSESVIRVRARQYGPQEAVENTRVEFSRQGDLVSVRTRNISSQPLGGKSICSVDFDVLVPPGCALRIDTVSAGVDVRDIRGTAELHTVSGNVRLDTASETSSISTVSGEISADALDGALHLSTVSGDAHITHSALNEFVIESVSGRVYLETPLSTDGNFRAKTVSGGIELHIPDSSGVTVHLASVSGRIQSDLPSNIEKVGFGDWRATINGGGTDVHFNSVSGGVTIAPLGVPVPA